MKAAFYSFSDVDLTDGFWKDRYDLNKNVSVVGVRNRFEETGRFDALRFNYRTTGKTLHIFFDSDAAKWMEAVAYLAKKDPDSVKDHLALCEELIDRMEVAQRPDGYLNSYFQQIEPDKIFTQRAWHELYCAGHLIEGAVAYAEATGKERFLHIMERYCSCIERAFMTEKMASFVTPGHEEIELALIKLYRYTKNEKYLDMARFFLEKRGLNEKDTANGLFTCQDEPIRKITGAHGHAVRALYLASGIADLAKETGDDELLASAMRVFDDIEKTKLYVTGGVGSIRTYEGFTLPYDLPNPGAYNESCASIALVFFCRRLREIKKDSRIGDVAERAFFNTVLSSTSLNGKAFFYENPTEINLEERGRDANAAGKEEKERLAITERLEVFGCSCCPPNINRLFASLGDYIFLDEDGAITVEQYFNASLKSQYGKVSLTGDYGREGKVVLSSSDYAAGQISIRIPKWSRKQTAILNGEEIVLNVVNGYASVPVGETFSLSLDFHMEPYFVSAHPYVYQDCGKVALLRGPVVYCLEGVDNGERLHRIEINPSAVQYVEFGEEIGGFPSMTLPAFRLNNPNGGELYYPAWERKTKKIRVKFIPYFCFANRGSTDLLTFVRRH